MQIANKTIVVTGAGSGIGRELSLQLLQKQANVVGVDINLNSLLETQKIAGVGDDRFKAFSLDITDKDKVDTLPNEVIQHFGSVDGIINNAGIIKRIPLLDMEVADFREVIDIDLVSPFIVSKHVAKGMIERRQGKIINICSMMSELGRNTVSAYAAAKGGLKMLTKNMATEWAKYNVQINGIGPGYFATEQTKPIRVDGHPFNDFIISRTPAAKWGDPSDLAGAAIFLSSKASDFVNGHILYVDGGILATIGKPSNEE